ncbi:MAG TPA: MFS transporter [Actinomycetes bacterium]|nr:MFS transporter [Actinomycetes bacterium]
MPARVGPPPPNAAGAGLLRSAPGFRSLWLSRTVSLVGDGIGRVALVLLAARAGPAAVSLVLLANTVPRFLGPIAGALADRVEQRRLMALCELGQALVIGLVAFLLPPLAVLVPLVAVAGLLATAFVPAGRSAVPALVATPHLTRANALLSTALNLQVALGSALGGLAVAWAGPRWAFAADAGTFVASAALLSRLPRLDPPGTGRPPTSLLGDTIAGLAYIARTRQPRALVLGLLLVVSFAAVDNVALVFLVRNSLGGSAGAYGATQACFGVGMLAASLALARPGSHQPPSTLLLGGVVATAAGTMLTGLAPSVGVAAATQALAGTGNAAENIASDTLVQRVVPRGMLGRVFGATATAAQAGSGIAYAAGGLLLAVVSPRTVFLIAGAGVLAALGVLLPVLRQASQRR